MMFATSRMTMLAPKPIVVMRDPERAREPILAVDSGISRAILAGDARRVCDIASSFGNWRRFGPKAWGNLDQVAHAQLPASKLEGLLACPDCRAPLEQVESCPACGARFDTEDGLPRLMPSARQGKFEVAYDNRRWQTARAMLDRVLVFPDRHGADRSMPFRIDLAYVDVVSALPPGARILELGCGGAQLRQWVEQRGHRYIGIDVSRTRVQDWLQAHGGPNLLGDAHFLPFRNDVFDLVVSSQVNEHLYAPLLAIQETIRVLKPGATFIGSGSFLEPWHDDSYFHLSPLGVLEMLVAAGFEPRALWPGWSGFDAMFEMGDRHTKPLQFVGKLLDLYYRAGLSLRARAKRALGKQDWRPIEGRAKMAGAINWIARKPD
jgi:SAM-dependent methyltransferase